MKLPLILLTTFLFATSTFAQPTVNVYVWGGEIPNKVIHQFEEETGIRVNFSTYDSNETLYAKLRAGGDTIYDVILPSSYYVERLQKQNMLLKLNYQKIPNSVNLDPLFANNQYDHENQKSIPLIWGTTGIFYNQNSIKKPIESWKQLWAPEFFNQLLLLDDAREIFAIALMRLGYPVNDANPKHIQEAYEQLLKLVPNIKLFSSEGIQAILIDEDATAGIVWNGDAFKAQAENQAIQFVYPEEGFVIWTDCLAIPRHAPHPNEAYAFLNFLLRDDIALTIGLTQGHAITNAKGKALLPEARRNNTMLYPSKDTLARAQFQVDPGEEAITLYNEYWQKLKLAF